MQATAVTDTRCVCGEGPLWHDGEKKLYYVDIPTGALFRYDPVSGGCETVFTGPQLGGFTIQGDGALLLFHERGTIRRWKDGVFTTVIEEIPDERETRFNDVSADPEGRVFCGTMPSKGRAGRLYRLDPDRKLTIVLEGIGCSNGIGYSPDGKIMYYVDSTKKEVYAFDYDRATGGISNQRLFAGIAAPNTLPDGMTVDAEGYVWVALWDGGGVVRFAPDGREDRRIELPCKKASSATFGGPGYADLYITSAGGGDREKEGAGAGSLFHAIPGVKGTAEFRSKIRMPE